MTDTTAPKDGLVRTAATALVAMAKTMITTTCTAIAAHWDKAINGLLGAVITVSLGLWTGYLSRPVAPPAPKVVEIVRTVPSNLEARVAAIEEAAKRIESKVDDMKPKGKKK